MPGKHPLGEPLRQDWGVCTWQNLPFAAHSLALKVGNARDCDGKAAGCDSHKIGKLGWFTGLASLADSLDWQAINLTESLHSFKKANNFRIAFLGMFCDQEHGHHIGSCFWSRIFRQFWMQSLDIPVSVNYAPFLANFHILIICDWVFWNALLILILVHFFFVSYPYKVWRCCFYFLISFNSPMSCI